MQTKTTMRTTPQPPGCLKSKGHIIGISQKLESSHTPNRNIKWCGLKKQNTELLYESVALLLSIYPREMKTQVRTKKYYTDMFNTVLFTVPKKWEIPKCSSINKCRLFMQWNIIQQ